MVEGKKTKAKAGEAPEMRRPEDIAELQAFLKRSKRRQDHDEVTRFKAVLSYIGGTSAIETAKKLKTVRSCVNKWIRWYVTAGPEGLLTQDRPGVPPKLNAAQLTELAGVIKAGPLAAGYQSGVWTGPMVGDLILQRYGVRYHYEYIPRLLARLHFSVQRPRKRLARADAQAQQRWNEERLPEIRKSPRMPRYSPVRGRGQLLARRLAASDVGAHR
jgi:transposase